MQIVFRMLMEQKTSMCRVHNAGRRRPRLKRLFGVTQTEMLRLLQRMQVEAIATRILAAIMVFTLQQWRR